VQFKLFRLDKVFGWTEPWHFHERIASALVNVLVF
jgi:hypothetical protein